MIDLVERLRPQFDSARCKVILEVQPNLKAKICGPRIEQVLTNIVTNALKFGEGNPITIVALMVGKTVKVSVKDNGIGISKEDQETNF